MKQRAFVLIVLVLAFSSLVIPVANAYIDPGSGSFIVQVAIGAFLGASLAIKVYWRKFIGFFTGRNKNAADEEHSTDEQ